MSFNGRLVSSSIFLIILIALTSMSVVAQDLDYVYPTNSTITINRPCFNSESPTGWCSASTQCKLSVLDTNNNLIILSQNMTNNQSIQTYTINSSITSNSIYQANIACVDGNTTGSDSFYFGVNNAGTDYRENSGIFFILGVIILLIIIFAALIFLVEEGLKLALLTAVFVMLPVALWLTLQIVDNSFMSEGVVNITSGGFILSLTALTAVALYALWKLTMGLKIEKNPEYGAPIYRNRGKQ